MSEKESSFRDLDRVIHERGRLAIVAALAAAPSPGAISFTELRGLLGLTDGNLITHLRSLEGAGYVRLLRGYSGGRPQTKARLTAAGRRAFERYIGVLEALLGPAARESFLSRAGAAAKEGLARGTAGGKALADEDEKGLVPG